jgi:alcohol dehydrogenase
MRQLTFVRKGRLEWREAPEPRLQDPGDALVRPFAVARCDADAALIFGNASRLALGMALHVVDPAVASVFGSAPYRRPFALGHEGVAEIVAVGEAVTRYRVGQSVIVPFQISCGRCTRCQQGLTGYCAAVPSFSAYGFGTAGGDWGGMLSDRLRVPYADEMLVAVPDGIDPIAIASLSDNLPDAWRAIGPQLRRQPGAPVLVVGGGAKGIGLYAAAIAVALGSSRVDYADTDEDCLALAATLGATPIAGVPAESGRTYPVSVDASGGVAGLAAAIRALEPGGVCTSVSPYFEKGIQLPLFDMYAKGLTLRTGFSNARADIPEVLALVRDGRLKPELVTTRLARWEDAAEALLDRSAKVVVARDRLAAVPAGDAAGP